MLMHFYCQSVFALRRAIPLITHPTFIRLQSLVNLGNRDPSLRLAAYNLLCALTTNFSLQINERLWEAKGNVELSFTNDVVAKFVI